MSTVTSLDNQFYVVLQCTLWVEAEAAATLAGGKLASLTSSNLPAVNFPIGSFDAAPPCSSPDQAGAGPIAWFGSWNGGVPVGTVFGVNLLTRQVYADSLTKASMWTRLVLVEQIK